MMRHEESVAHHLVVAVPRAGARQTAGQVLADLLAQTCDCVGIVCVVKVDFASVRFSALLLLQGGQLL